ncbi:tetratricopeptide repeat protein [Verrucomicrobium sp. BvORR106]|uniref:tetratricopeptide repeat protein n=1 Tax=Verrucomicrobium sp. BvORR106 TaxID=1403819 RepID=UPI00056DCCB2|nr:tetratricopeptide repeat protein [Verrucomicrobium sp. BvORR106]
MSWGRVFTAWSFAAVFFASPLWAGVYENGLKAKKEGRVDEAIELLGKATQAQPRNAEAWYHYGTVLGWKARNDDALEALRRGLAIAPKDFDLRMAEARVMAWKSDYAGADARLEKLEKEFPESLDVAVMRGRIAGWRGDPKEARHRYEEILTKDPMQVDALTGMGDLEVERNRVREARGYYERAVAIDASPENQKRLDGLDAIPKGRVDTGVTGSTFARGERDDWWGYYMVVTAKLLEWDVWARWEIGERFLLQDETYEFGASGQIVPGVRATVFGGFTPDAGYSANSYAEADVRWRAYKKLGRLGSGWFLTEGRWADYEAGEVSTSSIGWEQQLVDGWSVNARWVHLYYDTGEGTDGWVAYLSWEPKEGWLIRIGGGQAVESITNQTLQESSALESWTIFIGVLFPISEHWHFRVDLEREDVKDSVVRYGLALGVGCNF